MYKNVSEEHKRKQNGFAQHFIYSPAVIYTKVLTHDKAGKLQLDELGPDLEIVWKTKGMFEINQWRSALPHVTQSLYKFEQGKAKASQ